MLVAAIERNGNGSKWIVFPFSKESAARGDYKDTAQQHPAFFLMILGDKKVAPLSLRNYIFRAYVSKGESPAMSVCGFARKTALVAKRSISELCISTTHQESPTQAHVTLTRGDIQAKAAHKKFCFGAQRGVSSHRLLFLLNWISSSRLITRRTTFCPQNTGFSPTHKQMIYILLLIALYASLVAMKNVRRIHKYSKILIGRSVNSILSQMLKPVFTFSQWCL